MTPCVCAHAPEQHRAAHNGCEMVGCFCEWFPRSPRASDAHLIAAAPDLLEALQEWCDEPVACRRKPSKAAGQIGCDCWACERTTRARAAIAKAEGK